MLCEFIDAKKVLNTLKLIFNDENVNRIDIAVAYITKKGYNSLEKDFKTFLKRGGEIRIIVSLSGLGSTQSSALKLLLKTNISNPKFEVSYHCSRNGEFHPKIVIAKTNEVIDRILLGSSNFSGTAQNENSEANVLISSFSPQQNNTFLSEVSQFYEENWKYARKLDKKEIDRFALKEKQLNKIKSVLKKGNRRGGVTSTSLPNSGKSSNNTPPSPKTEPKINTKTEPHSYKEIKGDEEDQIYREIDKLVKTNKWKTGGQYESAFAIASNHGCSTHQILAYKASYTRKGGRWQKK